MPDYSVIADVSTTLQTVLTAALQPLDHGAPPVAEVSDLQGNISTNPARVTIFLFEAVEDPASRNRPRVPAPPPAGAGPNQIFSQRPPMALLLRYMFTPWSGDRMTDHRLLGRTLQIFYDGAIISGPSLRGGLLGTSQALKITLSPLTLDERARVWYAIEKPYRLSITYEVRVVNLDALTLDAATPVSQRVGRYVAPDAVQ
jgi:hypothetical protein